MSESPSHRSNRFLLVMVGLVILCAFLASRTQTAGGDVRVQEIRLPTQNGQWVAADLFRPVTATADNPAPLVVVVPGFQRSREALSNTAIELSRRGIVAISIDPYAQGRSSSSTSRRAATTEGYGSFALVDYAASSENLNYVDTSRIAITGHSAGGNAAIRAANYFGREAQRTGRPSKLHSVYMSGYVLTLRDDVLDDVQSNIGVAYALYDEGAYRNELGHGDLRSAPEALRVVNLGRSPDLPPEEEVEIGRYYG
ncbi:MAG: alpha/beta hydrolase, partial [Xanthomonadales bacterium]|nr:alpha/beta hydrolase [Xanthomonadales bacterium]